MTLTLIYIVTVPNDPQKNLFGTHCSLKSY